MRFSLAAIYRALRVRPGLVFVLHVGLLPPAVLAARLTGAQVAVMAHGIEVWGLLGPVTRVLIARCDYRVANSTFTAEWFAHRAGIEPATVTVVPIPVDARFEGAAQQCRGCPATPRRVLTVSRLSSENRYKGVLTVAAAMPTVLAACPDTRWVVVGDGDDLAEVRAACVQFGIGGSVDLLGWIDDERLVEEYAAAHVFTLPSVADPDSSPPTGEGFGLVYAEAACFGVPSIAAIRGGGSLDLIEHGITGLAVPGNDPRAVAGAVVRVLEDNELRNRLGAAARQRVIERHTVAGYHASLMDALTPDELGASGRLRWWRRPGRRSRQRKVGQP